MKAFNIQHPTSNIQHPVMVRAGAHWLLDVPRFILMMAIRAYQLTLSPVLSALCGPMGGCRYTPTCSVYAMEAVRVHGAVAGTALAAKRICRCHPWGGCGHDPVPHKSAECGVQSAELRDRSARQGGPNLATNI